MPLDLPEGQNWKLQFDLDRFRVGRGTLSAMRLGPKARPHEVVAHPGLLVEGSAGGDDQKTCVETFAGAAYCVREYAEVFANLLIDPAVTTPSGRR